ncbi:MAG: 3'-5' exonuclease family protein [Planctomycetota bacterium]|jgi:predicted PolB exonuclease-like 3'-5' exonuclease
MTCPAAPNEKELLLAFCNSVEHYGRRATLVSWNGRRFDLPCLVARCLHHRISIPWYWQNQKLRKRYADAGHIDLCDVMSEYGAGWRMSLDDAAVLCDIPGKTGEGASVEELVSEGRFEDLSDYCQNDLRITSNVFARHRYAAGQLSEVQLNAVDTAWEMWLAGELKL